MLHLLATTYRSDKRKCPSFLHYLKCCNYRALQSSCETVSVKNESFLLAAEQALSHICKGYNLKEM